MKNKKGFKRALPLLLAAVLWMEGTFGAVCAAEPVGQGQAAVEGAVQVPGGTGAPGNQEAQTPGKTDVPGKGETQNPGGIGLSGEEDGQDKPGEPGETGTPGAGETQSPSGEDGTQVPGETDKPGEGETQVPGETGKPGEGETQVPGETDKPGEGETQVPGETGKPGEDGTPTPGGTDEPGKGETQVPGETDKPGEEEPPVPGETDVPGEEEMPAPGETEATGGEANPEPAQEPDSDAAQGMITETVSENGLGQEEAGPLDEPGQGTGCALGEPPVYTGAGNGEGCSLNSFYGAARSGSVSRQTPGVQEIIDRYKAYPWSLTVGNSYSEKPSTKNPYKAGHLADTSLENARNLLNFIRYVAGIPANVTLNDGYMEKAQAGTLVNCVNGKMTHTPDPNPPEGFPDDLYALGREGCGSSNLASGYDNIAESLLDGWMYDGDSSNIAAMGHRRWVLNPSMAQTGFGAVGAYSAMYVFDNNGSSVTDFVAWPAQNMPIELMNGSGTPWTVSLGSDYQAADMQKVSVTLRDVSGSKAWTFSVADADGYFMVNTAYYGMPNCIIFRPNGVSYNKGSQFQVTVNGLTDREGKKVSLSYHVDFFSLDDQPAEVTGVTLDQSDMHLLLGDAEKSRGSLLATVKPGNATNKALAWRSGNAAVATVDAEGNVAAVGAGETEISATAVNGVQAVCKVRVSSYSLAVESLSVNSLTFDLTKDKTAKKLVVMDGNKAAGDQIKWVSENETVATVADGVVTPVGVGETTVWADVENGFAVLSCEVKVENSVLPALALREDAVTLGLKKNAEGNFEGDSRQLKVYLTPADGKWKRVRWKSDNPAAVAVSQAGGTVPEAVGGTSVLVKARGAGTAKVTAVLVDENEADVVIGGKKAEAVCTVTVQKEAELKEEDIPLPIALTNTQTTLKEVELPAGWSWKYPDVVLAQFAGQRSKKFAALYNPGGSGDTLSAERLLEVYFFTVESISVKLQTEDGREYTGSTLTVGQKMKCYVNYSFSDALNRLADHENYKKNAFFMGQKEKLLRELGNGVSWSSSKSGMIAVGQTGDGAGLTAGGAGSATLKGSLKLGKKTFHDSLKLTVTEKPGALTVTAVEGFRESGGVDGGDIYTAELSAFQTGKANQANSKITLTLPGASKVTAKSGNAGVVSVKAAAAEGGGFAVSLLVRAAGTAQITLTGNDAAKTSRTVTLTVADPEPGISAESVTVNTKQSTGAAFSLYPAANPAGGIYAVTGVNMADDAQSACFSLKVSKAEGEEGPVSCVITAKGGTKNGTYKTKLRAAVGGKAYELPLTVKVVSKKPVYKVKQVNKLNLFYKNAESLLQIDTEEQVGSVALAGCADYTVEKRDGAYYVKAKNGAALNSVRKGSLQITFAGYPGSFTTSFTVGVEKKAPKIALETGKVTFYPQAGIKSVRVGFKNAATLSGNPLEKLELSSGAKGNYEVRQDNEADPEEPVRGLILSGKNLNQAERFKAVIRVQDQAWTEAVTLSCNLKVSLGKPAIALGAKTLKLNANDAYKGYDAASTAVRWKDGGDILPDAGVRVSVYCDPKDARAKTLVQNSQAVFAIVREQTGVQVSARLNNKAVDTGSYKFLVQVSQNGQIWKTPLTLKVVNTAPDRAVKLSARGSIDVLDREGSFITLTPSLKAVNGTFVVPEPEDAAGDRKVELRGRDAHLFRAKWDDTGTKIELRAKQGETLVTKYPYTVTPVLVLKNAAGELEKIEAPAVKFQVKQGGVKVTVSPKTVQMYSGASGSVTLALGAALKGVSAPEIESVTLAGNTDVFLSGNYSYDGKTGKGSLGLTMQPGKAVKGKTYSLKLQVRLKEQADNVKPVTVRYRVKVK